MIFGDRVNSGIRNRRGAGRLFVAALIVAAMDVKRRYADAKLTRRNALL
jgi:hypothetical protein